MAPDPETPDLTEEEKDFLATMYKSMWDNINRHITAAGQAVGVLSTAFLAALLIKGDALTGGKPATGGTETYGMVVDFLSTLVVLAAGWTAAHAFDASLWFNRNIQILSNIEHFLLREPIALRVHPYAGRPRPNKVEGNLKLQVFLAAAIAVVTLLIHRSMRHVTFEPGGSLMFPQCLPYFAGAIAVAVAAFTWWRSVAGFRGFPDAASKTEPPSVEEARQHYITSGRLQWLRRWWIYSRCREKLADWMLKRPWLAPGMAVVPTPLVSETQAANPVNPGDGAPVAEGAVPESGAHGTAVPDMRAAAEPGRVSPLVYLCGSIGAKSFKEALEWRRKAAELLAPEFAVLSPLREYDGVAIADAAQWVFDPRETANKYTDAEIVARDLRDLRKCQVVLRHYTGSSEGSPMECAYAKQFDVPVVVSGIDDPASASPWLRYHSVKVLPTLEEAVDYIKRYWS